MLGIEKFRLKCKFHSINSYNFILVQLCSLTFKVIYFRSSVKLCQGVAISFNLFIFQFKKIHKTNKKNIYIYIYIFFFFLKKEGKIK